MREEEEKILQSVTTIGALVTASELAKGVKYEDPIKTRLNNFLKNLFNILFSWLPPRHIHHQSLEDHNNFRKKHGISVEGDDCPPPIGTFMVIISV